MCMGVIKVSKQSANELNAEIAFQYWVNDGIHYRTYEDVANNIGVSISTVFNWKRRFKWDERVYEITKKVNENIRRETEERIIAGCEYYVRGVDDIFAEYIRQIRSGERKISDEYMVKLLELSSEIQRGKYREQETGNKTDTTLSDFIGLLKEAVIE